MKLKDKAAYILLRVLTNRYIMLYLQQQKQLPKGAVKWGDKYENERYGGTVHYQDA